MLFALPIPYDENEVDSNFLIKPKTNRKAVMANFKKIIAISILSLMCSPFYAMDKGKGKAFVTWSPKAKQETPVATPSPAVENDQGPVVKDEQTDLVATPLEDASQESFSEAATATAKKESLMDESAIASSSAATATELLEESDQDPSFYKALEAELKKIADNPLQQEEPISDSSTAAVTKELAKPIVYTKHARIRMNEREVTSAEIVDTIKTGKKIRSEKGGTIYIEKNKTNPLAVIVNGKKEKYLVITLYKKEFSIIFSKKAIAQIKEQGLTEKKVRNIVKYGTKKFGTDYIIQKTNRKNPLTVKTKKESGQIIVDEIITRKQYEREIAIRKNIRDREKTSRNTLIEDATRKQYEKEEARRIKKNIRRREKKLNPLIVDDIITKKQSEKKATQIRKNTRDYKDEQIEKISK